MPAKMKRFEKQAQEAIERAQELLNDHPELNSVMLELNEAYGLLETALNPDNDSDPRIEFDAFVPQVYSPEYGENAFLRKDTFQEALAVLEQIQADVLDLDEDINLEYMVRCFSIPSS